MFEEDAKSVAAFPGTRLTLLQRLPNAADEAAWRDFVDLYGPVIFAFCLRRGCPRSDAADIVQEVLAAVARRIQTFNFDPARGRFRSWLFTIVRNKLIDRHRRQESRPLAPGEDWIERRAEEVPDVTIDQESEWETDYRRQLFHRALPALRPLFQTATWEAFRRTALEDADPAEVARELGLSIGAVYVAKSRVLARLREKVTQLGREWEPGFAAERLAAVSR